MTREVALLRQPAGGDQRRVLVVDDEIRYLESLTAVITAHGYDVRATRSPVEALATFQQWQPSIVILDVHLAGTSGFELLERLQALVPATSRSGTAPRFLVVSADTRFDTAVHALRAGARDYLAKPLRPERLIETLEYHFGELDAARAGSAVAAAALPAETSVPEPSAALAESILEEAPFLVYTLDADGNITFLNRRAEAVFGVDRSELISKPWTVMVYGERQLERARYRLNERRRGERATSNLPLTLVVPGQQSNPQSSARQVSMKLFSSGIYRMDDEGESFAGTCGIAAIEQLLDLPDQADGEPPDPEQTARQLGLALDELPLPMPVLYLDRQRRTLRHANPAAYQRPSRVRLTAERLLEWLEVPEAEWFAFLELADSQAVSGRMLGDIGGFPRWQASGFLRTDVDEIVVVLDDLGAAAMAHDHMIRLERNFQQSARIDAIRHIGGGLAHDFNNILASILGFTELAIAQHEHEHSDEDATALPTEDRTSTYLREAINAGHRARDLVQRIVQLCGDDGPEGGTEEPAELLERLLERTRQILPTTVQLIARIDPELPRVSLAADTLTRLFVHLLTNARDAVEGRGSIEITTEQVGPESGHCAACRREIRGRHIKVSVKDSGAGLPPGAARDLFHLVARTSRLQSAPGTGLAVIARELHDRNGHLQLHSMEGLGTVVSIYLPVETEAGQAPIGAGVFDVLIVEQDLSVGWLMSEYLEQLGYATQLQIDPYSALQSLEAAGDAVRVVICNADLKIDAGQRLLDRIAELAPAAQLIALTDGRPVSLPPAAQTLRKNADRRTLETLMRRIAPLATDD